MKIVNLNPAEIAAAWRRGDIDGAFVWSPALGEIRKAARSSPTPPKSASGCADIRGVGGAQDFAEKHPEIVARFARVSLDSFADYNAHKAEWTADSEPVKKIARLTGADPGDVPELLAGSTFPESQAQLSADLLGGGTARLSPALPNSSRNRSACRPSSATTRPTSAPTSVRQAEQVQVGQR